MENHIENIEKYNRIPSAIRVSEHAIVSIDELIGKVELVNNIISLDYKSYCLSEELGEEEAGVHEPLNWRTIRAMLQSLKDVQHALKCGLYGYAIADKMT